MYRYNFSIQLGFSNRGSTFANEIQTTRLRGKRLSLIKTQTAYKFFIHKKNGCK